jgi:phosphatidylglycerophosphate synthase
MKESFPGDAAYAALVAALALVILIAYALYAWLRGTPRFARVDRMGPSPMLGKRWLEVGYFALGPAARACIALGIGPNAVSWLSFLLGAGAGLALALGRFGLGAALALLSNACDALDGLVARETGVASDAGEVLDATIDRYNELVFLGGLCWYYGAERVLVALCVAALGGSFMVSYSTAKAEALGVEAPRGSMRRPERSLYLILGAVSTSLLGGWGVARFAEAPMLAALAWVAVVSNASAVLRLAAVARAVRERDRARRRAVDERVADEAESLVRR